MMPSHNSNDDDDDRERGGNAGMLSPSCLDDSAGFDNVAPLRPAAGSAARTSNNCSTEQQSGHPVNDTSRTQHDHGGGETTNVTTLPQQQQNNTSDHTMLNGGLQQLNQSNASNLLGACLALSVAAMPQTGAQAPPPMPQQLTDAQIQSLQALLKTQQQTPISTSTPSRCDTNNSAIALANFLQSIASAANRARGSLELRPGPQGIFQQSQQQHQMPPGALPNSQYHLPVPLGHTNVITFTDQDVADRTNVNNGFSNSDTSRQTTLENVSQMETETQDDNNHNNGVANKSGDIILPCRARGMPVDHNFRTAHFKVSPDVQHGADLICSYEACRQSGVKFRYCTTCKLAVARRNFRQRHSHGIPTVYNSRGSRRTEQAKIQKNTTVEMAPDRSKNNSTSAHDQSTTEKNNILPSEGTSIKSPKPKVLEVTTKAYPSSSSNCRDPPADEAPPARQLRWEALLGKRPSEDDADKMSAWLLEVMTVSNLKVPLKNSGFSSLTSSDMSSSGSPNDDSNDISSSRNASCSSEQDATKASDMSSLLPCRRPGYKKKNSADSSSNNDEECDQSSDSESENSRKIGKKKRGKTLKSEDRKRKRIKYK